jgi:hypothetical protein
VGCGRVGQPVAQAEPERPTRPERALPSWTPNPPRWASSRDTERVQKCRDKERRDQACGHKYWHVELGSQHVMAHGRRCRRADQRHADRLCVGSPYVDQSHVDRPCVGSPYVDQPHVDQPHVDQPTGRDPPGCDRMPYRSPPCPARAFQPQKSFQPQGCFHPRAWRTVAKPPLAYPSATCQPPARSAGHRPRAYLSRSSPLSACDHPPSLEPSSRSPV